MPPATNDRLGPDRYGEDVLAGDWRAAGRRTIPEVPATRDLVVELTADGYCGAVVAVEKQTVTLEDRHGRTRMFPLGPGFLVDGEPVRLVAPKAAAPQGRLRTASGSFAAESGPAGPARAMRPSKGAWPMREGGEEGSNGVAAAVLVVFQPVTSPVVLSAVTGAPLPGTGAAPDGSEGCLFAVLERMASGTQRPSSLRL